MYDKAGKRSRDGSRWMGYPRTVKVLKTIDRDDGDDIRIKAKPDQKLNQSIFFINHIYANSNRVIFAHKYTPAIT